MKGRSKTSLCLLLCLLLMFGTCVPGMSVVGEDTVAEDTQDEGVDVQDEGVDDQDEGTDEPVTPQTPAQEPVVARLYICCRVIFLGHTWIYVENKSAQPIQVGVVFVQPGEGVSVGTHALRRADGRGVYYNVEAYMIHQRSGSGTVARGMDLTAAQLQTVNDNIVYNNSWSLSNNCNSFATRVWNSVAPDGISSAFLPLTQKSRIGSGGAPSMFNPPRGSVLRQSGSGYGASTYSVKDGSLIIGIG